MCIYMCLLALFCLGAGELLFVEKGERMSESENRMLRAFPEFTKESVASGEFMDGFESYLSDAFFFRDEAASIHDGVMGVFALRDDSPDTGVVEDDRLWEQSDEKDAEFRELVESASPAPTDAPETTGAGQEDAGAEENSPQTASDASIWLVRADGSRETLFTFKAEDLVSFAGILNRYRDKLPEDGRLYFFSPQVSAVANNVIGSTKYVGWGSDLEDVMQPLVEDGVYIYDSTDILSPYLNEKNLYPIHDYHWHSVSASITADYLMSEQGFAPAGYDQYCYYLGFKNDYIAYSTKQLESMHYGRDTIEIMRAISPAESYILNNITERKRAVFTMPEGGYVGFLGGHKGPWRLIIGGYHTGRNALIVGDCFTTPLIPYLTPYYDVIISTDVRDNFYSVYLAGGNIGDYIEAYDIDDIYVVWSTNARFYSYDIQSRMSAYLDLEYPS